MIKQSFLLALILIYPDTLIASDYNQSTWREWQKEYNQSLIGKDGWLRLAGLYWLEPGNNTLGSADHNMHRFPADAPLEIGSINLYQDKLIFKTKDTNVLVDGKKIDLALLSSTDTTRVKFSHYEFFALQREGKFALRLVDNKINLESKFAGSRFMSFDQSLVVKATLVPRNTPQTINVATVYGTNRKEKSAGWIEFNVNNTIQRIEAVDYGRDLPLYLFFSDLTNGETTYDAGRYLKVEWPDKNGATIVDFNRAYNPPCAYTPYATCPLTPPQNRLNVPIKAGELNYLKKVK